MGVELDSEAAYIGDLSQITTYDSAVMPAVEELYMTVNGSIERIYVTLGDQVKKGDVLLELDESATQEAHDELAEQIEHTKTINDYNNRLAMLDIEILKNQLRELESRRTDADAPADLEKQIALKQVAVEQAELNLKQQQETQQLSLQNQEAALAELAAKLGQNKLIAPCDGRVAFALTVKEGDWLAAYKTVVYLADESRLYLSGESISAMTLSTADEVYALIDGARYEITKQELDREEYIALILAGTAVPARFTFDAGDHPEGVEAGMYAAVCVVTKQFEDVLLVPTNAVLRDSTGKYVYVIGENGQRARRSIKTGASTAWLTQVTEGLEEGEVVYVKN